MSSNQLLDMFYEIYRPEMTEVQVFQALAAKMAENFRENNLHANAVSDSRMQKWAKAIQKFADKIKDDPLLAVEDYLVFLKAFYILKRQYDFPLEKEMTKESERELKKRLYRSHPDDLYVKDAGGWHFVGPRDIPVTARFSLNVNPHAELIQKLDSFCLKHHVQYKYPVNLDDWYSRVDPVTVYLQKEPTPEIQKEFADLVKPYVRTSRPELVNELDGHKIADGIFWAKDPNKKMAQDLIKKLSHPSLKQAAEEYAQHDVSLGMQDVIAQFVELDNVLKEKFKTKTKEKEQDSVQRFEYMQNGMKYATYLVDNVVYIECFNEDGKTLKWKQKKLDDKPVETEHYHKDGQTLRARTVYNKQGKREFRVGYAKDGKTANQKIIYDTNERKMAHIFYKPDGKTVDLMNIFDKDGDIAQSNFYDDKNRLKKTNYFDKANRITKTEIYDSVGNLLRGDIYDKDGDVIATRRSKEKSVSVNEAKVVKEKSVSVKETKQPTQKQEKLTTAERKEENEKTAGKTAVETIYYPKQKKIVQITTDYTKGVNSKYGMKTYVEIWPELKKSYTHKEWMDENGQIQKEQLLGNDKIHSGVDYDSQGNMAKIDWLTQKEVNAWKKKLDSHIGKQKQLLKQTAQVVPPPVKKEQPVSVPPVQKIIPAPPVELVPVKGSDQGGKIPPKMTIKKEEKPEKPSFWRRAAGYVAAFTLVLTAGIFGTKEVTKTNASAPEKASTPIKMTISQDDAVQRQNQADLKKYGLVKETRITTSAENKNVKIQTKTAVRVHQTPKQTIKTVLKKHTAPADRGYPTRSDMMNTNVQHIQSPYMLQPGELPYRSCSAVLNGVSYPNVTPNTLISFQVPVVEHSEKSRSFDDAKHSKQTFQTIRVRAGDLCATKEFPEGDVTKLTVMSQQFARGELHVAKMHMPKGKKVNQIRIQGVNGYVSPVIKAAKNAKDAAHLHIFQKAEEVDNFQPQDLNERRQLAGFLQKEGRPLPKDWFLKNAQTPHQK